MNLVRLLLNRFKIHKKVFIFFLGFILFGTLSFIYYNPIVNNSKTENQVILISKNVDQKQNNNYNKINKKHKKEFALIVGTFKKKYNADNLELEMKKRGFKDCTIISDKKLNKYWVVLKSYNNKNQALLDRERYLLDGWIKQL